VTDNIRRFPRSARIQNLNEQALEIVASAVARHARQDAMTWATVKERTGLTWQIDADADAAICTALAMHASLDIAALHEEQRYELYWQYVTHYADTRRELLRPASRRIA
jgi:hypothetical protein